MSRAAIDPQPLPGTPEARAQLEASKAAAKAAMKLAKNKPEYLISDNQQYPPITAEERARIDAAIENANARAKYNLITALSDEEIAARQPWELTCKEHRKHPRALKVGKGSILTINLSTLTPEDLDKYTGKELAELAKVIGAKKSGSKEQIISNIFKIWETRRRISTSNLDELSKLSVKELNALLDTVGKGRFGNRRVKATTLINWLNQCVLDAKRLISDALHLARVNKALEDGQFHLAIAQNSMTADRAKEIIESADLVFPAELAGLDKEQYLKNPIVPKVKWRQLKFDFMLEP